jgi:15-hydroxyprostaglandin dehydrogenase (NAD)
MATNSPPVALITGAASGMGLALTKHFVSKGWKVGMCDINGTLGDREAAALNNTAGKESVLFRRVDITDYTAHATFFRDVFEWGGGHIDYFAANAGITEKESFFKRVDRMKVDEQGLPKQCDQSIVDINLRAVIDGIWLYRFFAAKRKDGKKGGKITVTASNSAFYPFPSLPLYGATKHAVLGLVRSTAYMLKKEGIAINAVCPGFVKTGLLSPEMLKYWPEDKLTPMKTVLDAHDTFLGSTRSGEALELSLDKMYWRKVPDFIDDHARWVTEDAGDLWKKIMVTLPSRL